MFCESGCGLRRSGCQAAPVRHSQWFNQIRMGSGAVHPQNWLPSSCKVTGNPHLVQMHMFKPEELAGEIIENHLPEQIIVIV